MPGFLEEFLSDAASQQVIATDPLPQGVRDTLLLDPALFDSDDSHGHDHGRDDKTGSCGNACGSCAKRGTPECADH